MKKTKAKCPCDLCFCLPICKHKETLRKLQRQCSYLYSYIYPNAEGRVTDRALRRLEEVIRIIKNPNLRF